MIGVSGDPLRNHVVTIAHNGLLGFPVAREIELPTDWDATLRAAR